MQLFEPRFPLVKEAGTLMPEIKAWRNGYTPQDGKIAVLVNALGASEYWGQNVNGDAFFEASLIHDCRNHRDQAHPYDDFTGKPIPPYGYWTFLDAKPYCHHRNKDPNRAFGDVVLAAWNAKMHRVELIILIDKALAMQHGAQDVIDRILAGEYPDVSMGTRVPYDLCLVCGHKSKTRNDYCTCVKEIGMGKILDDGRRIGVANPHPRFFDISFVFIGADKTAKVMCKLASGLTVPQSIADADLLYGVDEAQETGLVKAASDKRPWYKSELFEGGVAGSIGGLASVGLVSLLGSKGKPSKELFKSIARAASEGGIAGATGAGAVTAFHNLARAKSKPPSIRKHGSVDPGLSASDVEVARSPDTEAARKKLDEVVLDRVMGRTEAGVAIDEKTAGLKDLGSISHLFENIVGKHVKARVGRRSIRMGNLLKKAAERPDPTDDADTRLLMGRIDDQESPTAIGDGTVVTNLTHNMGEDSAGVDRSSGFRAATPSPGFQLGQRPKAFGFAPRAPVHRAQWSGDVGGDSAHLSKESSGLDETFERVKAIKIGSPPNPNRKEHPFIGTIGFKGLTIHVENAPGSVREGKGWRTEMKLPYGEILSTRGTDGDKLDVYVGPWSDAENAYIVHQNFVGGPKDGKYDEDKVMLGFRSADEAKAAYLAHYSSPKFFRSITAMAFPLFKKAILRKEAHGEKFASAWGGVIADMVMEDEFQTKEAAPVRRMFGEWKEAVQAAAEYNARIPEDWVDVLGLVPRQDEMSGLYFLTYRPLSAKRLREVFGMEKSAASLEDLFSSSATACRRQRTWRDKVTGRETNVTGSGMESSEKAKTASVSVGVMKLARVLCSGWSPEELLKVSNETKAAAYLKWADIVKRIGPSKAVGRVTPLLSQSEPNLPVEVLNKLGEDEDLKKSLTTPALMGMMLKPREFQRIILIHIGRPDVADKLDAKNEVFKPNRESVPPCGSLESGHFDESILKALLPFLEGKSYAGPVVRRRIIRIVVTKPASHPKSKEVDSPLLSKVASAYTWYRKEVMKLARALPATVAGHPELHARTLGIDTEDLFNKTAADIGLSPRSIAVLLGTVPLSLLYSAHKSQEKDRGEDIGLLGALIAEHPWLTSMGVVTGLGALLRDPRAERAVDELFAAGKRVWRGKQAPTSV